MLAEVDADQLGARCTPADVRSFAEPDPCNHRPSAAKTREDVGGRTPGEVLELHPILGRETSDWALIDAEPSGHAPSRNPTHKPLVGITPDPHAVIRPRDRIEWPGAGKSSLEDTLIYGSTGSRQHHREGGRLAVVVECLLDDRDSVCSRDRWLPCWSSAASRSLGWQ